MHGGGVSGNANAEASSSRTQLDGPRTRSRGGKARASGVQQQPQPQQQQKQLARPVLTVNTADDDATSPTVGTTNTTTTPTLPPAFASSRRKVRTVPPSAVFEPPTPPPGETESPPTFDTHRPAWQQREHQRHRPRRHVRYVSSDDEHSSSSAGDDSSDDDTPPWWTFTQRGMTKLRQMGDRASSRVPPAAADLAGGGADATEPDSGREGPLREKERRRRLRDQRLGSGDKRRPSATPPRVQSGVSTPTAAGVSRTTTRLFHPRPFRVAPPSYFGRRSSEQTGMPSASYPADHVVAVPPEMTRSNSAPISPVAVASPSARSVSGTPPPPPQPTLDGRGAGAGAGGGGGGASNVPDSSSPEFGPQPDDTPRRPAKRPTMRQFMSMPTRNSIDGNMTDSDALMPSSPRRKVLQKHLWDYMGRVPEEGGTAAASSMPSSPNRPRRINAQNLRIRLPEPISKQFQNGWPHAGSWQDALRHGGMFDEDMVPSSQQMQLQHQLHQLQMNRQSAPPDTFDLGDTPPVPGVPPAAAGSSIREGENSNNAPGAASTDTDGPTPPNGTGARPMHRPRGPPVPRSSSEATHATPKIHERRQGRRKSKKHKPSRYRPAEIPPTPGPGGYMMRNTHDWGRNEQPVADPNTNPFDRLDHFDMIDEEGSLSPQHTHVSEKSTRPWGFVGRFRRKQRQPTAYDHLTWRQRFRRMILLDARITIYIRLWNLATVVTLLALAITIRRKLNSIGYGGVIGPSTTLIISYAAFTIVHVLIAMFREYFGRPVGLWGLRSKMLWVCLDLLFVALWSSACTLAINDYVDTPLDCTPLSPWWTPGVDYYITDGNNDTRAATATASAFTSTLTAAAAGALRRASAFRVVEASVPESVKHSAIIHDVCSRQIGCFAISLVTLLLYCGNMVLSLFRIFETVRRTAPHAHGPGAV